MAGEAEAKVAGNLSQKLTWELANPKWAATLNPVLSNPVVSGSTLSGLVLVTGANVINHFLGRKLQGYAVVMNSAAVTYYDSQLTNPKPELTLILNASGPATVSIYVY